MFEARDTVERQDTIGMGIRLHYMGAKNLCITSQGHLRIWGLDADRRFEDGKDGMSCETFCPSRPLTSQWVFAILPYRRR
jgi:hypothetical protein